MSQVGWLAIPLDSYNHSSLFLGRKVYYAVVDIMVGEHAIQLIRNKLGSTDPTKAQEGTIRIDYGHDLMRNGAHASDSVESADRERKIVGLVGTEPSGEKMIIENWLNATK